MAVEHLSFRVFSRSTGASAVMKAAYRAGQSLHDERVGLTYNFEHKTEVAGRSILAPDGAPAWVHDREKLWNTVERVERRKDSQLAREFDVAFPLELTLEQREALLREYLTEHFVARGMVADYAIHDKADNPHAHVMLSLRAITPEGFGQKVRAWNARENVKTWRQAWEDCANRALEQAGRHERIDMRSYADRGVDLEPMPKRFRASRDVNKDGRDMLRSRAEDAEAVCQRNGERILARPELVLELLTTQQSVFTEHDLLKAIHRHTSGHAQFERARHAVFASPELLALGSDTTPRRFSTRAVVAIEEALYRHADGMHARVGHAVHDERVESAILASSRKLNDEQAEAVRHVTRSADLAVVQGYAGTGKSTMLAVARAAWESSGCVVVGGALAGKAAEGLSDPSSAGIPSRTLASWEWAWKHGRDELTSKHVLVIDEAGMVGSKQLERVMGHAHRAGAKVVLVGDTRQLSAIDPGAPMRVLQERIGAAKLTNVVRQTEHVWQREATKAFGDDRSADALSAYAQHGKLVQHDSTKDAITSLVSQWDRDRREHPNGSALLVTFRRTTVRALNEQARAVRRAAGELGPDHRIRTQQRDQIEQRDFAAGDRLYFLQNDARLGVTNGTLGTLERIEGAKFVVKLDSGRTLTVDTKKYNHLDHGYAATIHKSQGVTVDRAYVLASKYMSAAATYVAMSRHRLDVHLHWSTDEFKTEQRLIDQLSTRREAAMAIEEATRPASAPPGVNPTTDAAKFLAQSAAEQAAQLALFEREAIAPTTNTQEAYDGLPAVRGARAEHAAASEAVRVASTAFERFKRNEKLATALRTAPYREVAEALVQAQTRLLVAEDALRGVTADPKLRVRAELLASQRNGRIAKAHARWTWAKGVLRAAERDKELRSFLETMNTKRGAHPARLAEASDQGERFEVLAKHAVKGKDVFFIRRPGRGQVVLADSDTFAAPPAIGTSAIYQGPSRTASPPKAREQKGHDHDNGRGGR